MAISDILKSVGEGVEKAGRAAVPVLERTAQVVSGEAPQIDEEQRKRQFALEDQQISAKAQQLESQLAMGQKYGTLTPDQQQQYVDQISSLYSHPRHAGTLMEKLRKAIHPNGVFAQGPQAPLPNATPPGGTAITDEQARAAALADAIGLRQQATDEEIDRRAKTTAQYHKPAGKSPPVPGSQLPLDAIGPDGQIIPTAQRSVGQSFVEWNGAWYAAPKAKPIYKNVAGNVYLMDPTTGLPQRKLGPSEGMKVTSHQAMQPGDDGQMHMYTTYSVSTPQGENIEVEMVPPESAQTGQGKQNTIPSPKTDAKKVGPGSLLPKTGAKPVAQGMPPAVPGLSSLANRKLETNADRQVLESGKQIISAVDDLLPILEKRKNQGGYLDAAQQTLQFQAYKAGIPPSDPELTKIFEESALLGVIGASIWSRIGRSKYTFEIIQQHLPKPTDTPKLMYDKVKWLKDNVVPAAQEAIKNPQPDSGVIVVSPEDLQ